MPKLRAMRLRGGGSARQVRGQTCTPRAGVRALTVCVPLCMVWYCRVRRVHVRAGVSSGSDASDGAAASAGDTDSQYAVPHDPADHPGLPEMFEGERWEIMATETEVESSEGDSEEFVGEPNIDLMNSR